MSSFLINSKSNKKMSTIYRLSYGGLILIFCLFIQGISLGKRYFPN